MKTIIITTPDNIEISYRLAGAGSRLAAATLDLLIQALLFTLITVVLLLSLSTGAQSAGFGGFITGADTIMDIFGLGLNSYVAAFAILAYFVIYFCYFIICEMVMNGRSPGKKVFRLRVIMDNGQPIGLPQSMIRNIFRCLLDITGIGVVLILFSKKNKRLGDMVASSIVISENPGRLPAESLSISDLAEAEEITGVDISELSPDEYYLLKEYFQRKIQLPDDGEHIRQLLIEYFQNEPSSLPLSK